MNRNRKNVYYRKSALLFKHDCYSKISINCNDLRWYVIFDYSYFYMLPIKISLLLFFCFVCISIFHSTFGLRIAFELIYYEYFYCMRCIALFLYSSQFMLVCFSIWDLFSSFYFNLYFLTIVEFSFSLLFVAQFCSARNCIAI